jgi:hypothetical protein
MLPVRRLRSVGREVDVRFLSIHGRFTRDPGHAMQYYGLVKDDPNRTLARFSETAYFSSSKSALASF